jgi:hypothetical protein
VRVLDELVRSGLAELADLAFQERVWAGEGGSEMSSFTEAVATLFVDSGLDLAYERDESVYGPALDQSLQKLSGIVGKIDGMRPPREVITDPLMGRARALAADILRRLGDSAESPPSSPEGS